MGNVVLFLFSKKQILQEIKRGFESSSTLMAPVFGYMV